MLFDLIPAPGEILVPPRAKGLSLTGPEINDEVAARIAMCHDLTSLTLSGTAITDEGLRQIAEGTRLQRLTLTDARFTDAGLAHLAKLPLRHLELRGAHLTNATFIHHAKIPTLVRMDIMNSRSALTIDGMTALKEAPRLRTLWITGFPHDANYAALGELKQLRELHFEMSLTELRDLETLEVALPHTRIMAGTGGGWVGGFGRERKKPPTPKAK